MHLRLTGRGMSLRVVLKRGSHINKASHTILGSVAGLATGKGLQEKWQEIVEVLTKIVPVYDKMNRLMSLGQDMKWRREGLLLAVRPGDMILDAGCGPGVMSELALRLIPDLRITLLDPLDVMLDAAKSRISNPLCKFTKGFFEELPFPHGVFDVVMCGFSLRDSKDLDRALDEIKRVLKPGGKLLLVDLGKPDNQIMRWLTGGYWRIFVPLMAVARLGRTGLLYYALYKTYKRHPPNRQLLAKLRTYFKEVKIISRMAGSAVIIICSR